MPLVPRRSGDGERGSVLALVPAGFLVLIVLGALAVDSASAYRAHQQLRDALAAAANDAVSAAVDNPAFYSSGAVSLDPGAVAATVCRSVEGQGLADLHGLHLAVTVSGRSVRVVGRATVDAVFGRALPGLSDRPVSASADATLASGPVRPGSPAPSSASRLGAPVALSCR